MNARQKAKHYKRKYEHLKKLMSHDYVAKHMTTTNYPIVTLKKSVFCTITEFNRDTWKETAKKHLCESAASELSQYISFEVEEDNRPCFAYPHMTVTATLKVVDLNREEQTNEQNIR